jgi:hypothetical protein
MLALLFVTSETDPLLKNGTARKNSPGLKLAGLRHVSGDELDFAFHQVGEEGAIAAQPDD